MINPIVILYNNVQANNDNNYNYAELCTVSSIELLNGPKIAVVFWVKTWP